MHTLDRLESRQFLSAVLLDGTLTITGTDAADSIWVELAKDGRIRAAMNNTSLGNTSLGLFKADQVLQIVIDGGGGDDFIRQRVDTHPGTLIGGHGNDTILGAESGDFVHGGPGDDDLESAGGRDTVVGGSGDDCILGGNGVDLINGSSGDDYTRTDGRDSISQVETREREGWLTTSPVEDATALVKASVEQENGSANALLDFRFPSTGWHVDVTGVRRVGSHIRITVQLSFSPFSFPAVTEQRVVVSLGNLPDANYVVTVAGVSQFPVGTRAG